MDHEVEHREEVDPEVVLRLTLKQSEAGALATVLMEDVEWGQYVKVANNALTTLHSAFKAAANGRHFSIRELRLDGRGSMWSRRAEDLDKATER